MSVAVLAASVGTTRTTIYRIENGQQEPSVSLMRLLSEATQGEVTPEEILRACLDAAEAA